MAKPASYTDPQVIADITAAKIASAGNFKAIVCIFLFGANDHYNTVMPLSGPNRQQYDFYRSNQTDVGIPVGQSPTNHIGSDWRLHHNLPALKGIWDAGKLGVVMNVGMLHEPTDRAKYLAKSVSLPDQLFSHNSQQQQWQTLPPSGALTTTHGWMGRAADLAGDIYNDIYITRRTSSMSVSGVQAQMVGYEEIPAYLSPTGAVVLNEVGAFGSTLLSGNYQQTQRGRSPWDNIVQGFFGPLQLAAIASQSALNSVISALPATPDGRFTAIPNNTLAQQLKTVARVIHSRVAFEHFRQMFFVSLGGFDNHSNLRANHDPLMTTVNDAINAFWQAMGDLSLQNDVVVFTESDFGRTLVSNGSNGSDHGWGGHHFLVGNKVNGGIYNLPYDMTVNGPQDSGQGRSIPTLSVDQYVATILEWWGIPAKWAHLVVPNLRNFQQKTIPGLLTM